MNVLNMFDFNEWKDLRQFAHLSLGVHLLQRRRDEVIIEPVVRQELTPVRVRSVAAQLQ